MLEINFGKTPQLEREESQDTVKMTDFLSGFVEVVKTWDTLTPEEKDEARLTYGPAVFSIFGFSAAFTAAFVSRII